MKGQFTDNPVTEWCSDCRSHHPKPVSIEHHAALMCHAPWKGKKPTPRKPTAMTDDELLDEVCGLIRASKVNTYDRKRFLAVGNELKDRGFKF